MNNNKNKVIIIGLGGVARAGKNTAEQLLISRLGKENCYSSSFAKSLREETKDYIRQNFDIDAYTQNTEEKELIRPILIYHAKIKRKLSKGQYFVNKLKKELFEAGFSLGADLKSLYHEKYKYIIINDLRFGYYYNQIFNIGDEIGFIKSFDGIVVHIARLDQNNYIVPPFSEEEKINDPIVKKHCDYSFEWPTINSDNIEVLGEKLDPFAGPIINLIKNKND